MNKAPDPYLASLRSEFESNANAENARQQKAYLKDLFPFYGIKTPLRRKIQRPFLVQEQLPPKAVLTSLVHELWHMPQREYHYFAQELSYRYKKCLDHDDISLFEFMITHNSWWDTVDFIATKLIKAYFHSFPQKRNAFITKWISSGNIWLQRSCLIFQLHEKERTDVAIMTEVIRALLGSQEFFINKAIGWALRDYSRTNADWVVHFVSTHELHPLSKREALKLLR